MHISVAFMVAAELFILPRVERLRDSLEARLELTLG